MKARLLKHLTLILATGLVVGCLADFMHPWMSKAVFWIWAFMAGVNFGRWIEDFFTRRWKALCTSYADMNRELLRLSQKQEQILERVVKTNQELNQQLRGESPPNQSTIH